ncbi:MAG: DUF4286 family protein [Flavobacteriales bacterium]
MILYNVTINLDENIHQEWLEWMKTKHIPDVMNTGCFIESKIYRIHSDDEGVTFAVQYLCEDMNRYEKYRDYFAQPLQQEHIDKFQGKFAAFRTILEIVHQHK